MKRVSMHVPNYGEIFAQWGSGPMPRYVRQADKWRCGPILACNILKHMGVRCSWRDNKKNLVGLLRACAIHGTMRADISSFLGFCAQKYSWSVKEYTQVHLEELRKVVGEGGCVGIEFNWGKFGGIGVNEGEGHYTLLVDIVGKKRGRGEEYFGMANLGLGSSSIEYLEKNEFRRLLLRKNAHAYFWFIRPKSSKVKP